MVQDFQIKHTSPTVDDFLTLRAQVGWQNMSAADAQVSLQNSLFHVSVYNNAMLIGMGRIVGDGVMYFYIQDVVVAPKAQGLGIGTKLMSQIEDYIAKNAKQGATIGLLSAKGKENFYSRFGYTIRPNEALGHGMCKFI